jgi:hypothetical protein
MKTNTFPIIQCLWEHLKCTKVFLCHVYFIYYQDNIDELLILAVWQNMLTILNWKGLDVINLNTLMQLIWLQQTFL